MPQPSATAFSVLFSGATATASTPDITLDELPRLYSEIAPRILPCEPQPQAIPYLWRWVDIAPLAQRSAKLVPIEHGGERRGDRLHGVGQLRPTWEHPAGSSSLLLSNKWERTEEALWRPATSGASPFDDVALEYINPHTDGPALPTIACWLQLIRPGVYTKAHRQTHSAVYPIFRGKIYGHQWRALRLEDRRLLRCAAMGLA